MTDVERVVEQRKADLVRYKEEHGLTSLKGVTALTIAKWLYPEESIAVQQTVALATGFLLLNMAYKG